MTRDYAATGVDGIGVDTGSDIGAVAAMLPAHMAVQGNLDPLAVVAGGAAMAAEAAAILDAMRGRPFIFNLGHGIVPQTPPEHVAALLEQVRAGCGDPVPGTTDPAAVTPPCGPSPAASRDRPVQPRRPRPPRGDQAVSAQPVPRPRHPARPVLRAPVSCPEHCPRARRPRHRQLRPAGRKIPAARPDPGASRRAGGRPAGGRSQMFHRHALLAPVQPGSRTRGEGMGAG